MFSHIRIVLVETSHPGNIGAAARAMKNMGLSRLYLVAPHHFPSADATARASGADNLLANAVVCSSVAEAIADCDYVIGASARSRTIEWPEITPRECAEKLMAPQQHNETAILFGRENSGLTNQEMDRCHVLLQIPCNPAFSSLNMAAAVQVISYELFQAAGVVEPAVGITPHSVTEPLATAEQMASFYDHLFQTLSVIGFIHPDKSRSIMRRLRRLFNRAQPARKELDILRGILSAMQQKKSRSIDSS